jgi:hypothetical protein
LGSKVSICDTPPFEKMKMTRFAFAPWCGDFGENGSAESSASNWERNPGRSKELPTKL